MEELIRNLNGCMSITTNILFRTSNAPSNTHSENMKSISETTVELMRALSIALQQSNELQQSYLRIMSEKREALNAVKQLQVLVKAQKSTIEAFEEKNSMTASVGVNTDVIVEQSTPCGACALLQKTISSLESAAALKSDQCERMTTEWSNAKALYDEQVVEQAKELNSLRESKAQLEKKSAQLRLLVDKTNQVIAVQQDKIAALEMWQQKKLNELVSNVSSYRRQSDTHPAWKNSGVKPPLYGSSSSRSSDRSELERHADNSLNLRPVAPSQRHSATPQLSPQKPPADSMRYIRDSFPTSNSRPHTDHNNNRSKFEAPLKIPEQNSKYEKHYRSISHGSSSGMSHNRYGKDGMNSDDDNELHPDLEEDGEEAVLTDYLGCGRSYAGGEEGLMEAGVDRSELEEDTLALSSSPGSSRSEASSLVGLLNIESDSGLDLDDDMVLSPQSSPYSPPRDKHSFGVTSPLTGDDSLGDKEYFELDEEENDDQGEDLAFPFHEGTGEEDLLSQSTSTTNSSNASMGSLSASMNSTAEFEMMKAAMAKRVADAGQMDMSEFDSVCVDVIDDNEEKGDGSVHSNDSQTDVSLDNSFSLIRQAFD